MNLRIGLPHTACSESMVDGRGEYSAEECRDKEGGNIVRELYNWMVGAWIRPEIGVGSVKECSAIS